MTLVTGDRILAEALPDGRWGVTVMPVDPHETFELVDTGDDLYVIPTSTAPLIPHRLDRELFNVAELLRRGLDDTTSRHLPVIIEHERNEDPELPATLETTSLDSIDATASVVVKSRASQLGEAIAEAAEPGSADPLDGVEKIWLDPEFHVAIDRSVPQIGASQLHSAGTDGTGTTVAVLDTGIDASHPDLEGQLTAERNFTTSPSTSDLFGHGTHVASIIAGTGAASGGQYRGVAPGATLLNGKVLDDMGSGLGSWVIAGMEWAAESGSDVVNMSLGGAPTDGTDPLSQAVDSLTDQFGTLFVVAAGNNGPWTRTIGAPGAASSALTIGAVTRSEALASFSSRGPRLGDFAIKPDVTAPGSDIVAARASGTSMGTPLNERYTRASGTSMAAPHAAGAAALLVHRHPEWEASELKTALITTGVPRANNTVYEQGGGRIDVANAADAVVIADPVPLDMRLFAWPHGGREPETHAIRFSNTGTEAITLDLSLEVRNEDGSAPEAGMLTVSPAAITIPASGLEEAHVTLDPDLGTPGSYGGYLVARRAGVIEVRVPVGFTKELERYDVTVTGIGRSGQPAAGLDHVYAQNVDNSNLFFEGRFFIDGRVVFRVPPGSYDLLGSFRVDEGTRLKELHWVSRLEVDITEDTEITLDARDTNPIDLDLPGYQTVARQVKMSQFRRSVQGSTVQIGHVIGYEAALGAAPTVQSTKGTFEFNSQFRLLAPDAQGQPSIASPYLFDLLFPHPGGVPDDLAESIDPEALGRIQTRFAVQETPRNYDVEWRSGIRPNAGGLLDIGFPIKGGHTREDFVSPGDTFWRQNTCLRAFNAELDPFYCLTESPTTFTPGEARAHTWYGQPSSPQVITATRGPREMEISLDPIVDADGHGSTFVDGLSQSWRFFEDGALIDQGEDPFIWAFLEDRRRHYKLEYDTQMAVTPWTRLSSSTTTVWEFDSGPQRTILPVLDQPLPLVDDTSGYSEVPSLLTVAWAAPELDLRNRAPMGTDPFPIEVDIGHLEGAQATEIEEATLSVSYDDGGTWQEVSLQPDDPGGFLAMVEHPDREETSGYVSLRVEARDAGANSILQEIVRAYALEAPEDPVEPITTSLRLTDRSRDSGQYTDDTLFEARLVELDGPAVAGVPVTFELTGEHGTRTFTATTDADGIAAVSPQLTERPGTYQVTARYAGSGAYDPSADTTAFIIEREDTIVELSVEGKGTNRALTARLSDSDSDGGIAGATIDFYADGELIGTVVTDEAGRAILKAPPGHRGGKRSFEARFGGDDYYLTSSDRREA